MSIPIVTRQEAKRLSKKKGVSLSEAREELEPVSIRIRPTQGTTLKYWRGFPVRFRGPSLLIRLRNVFGSSL